MVNVSNVKLNKIGAVDDLVTINWIIAQGVWWVYLSINKEVDSKIKHFINFRTTPISNLFQEMVNDIIVYLVTVRDYKEANKLTGGMAMVSNDQKRNGILYGEMMYYK